MADSQVELVSPDGRRAWVPADALEATNLKARGWAPKPAKPAPASK